SLAPILGSILQRDGMPAPWVDTSHGSSLAIPPPNGAPVVYVTTDEASEAAQALRSQLRPGFERPIPCEDVTLRAYLAPANAVRAAVDGMLPARLDLRTSSGIELRRLSVERRLEPGRGLTVAVEWARPEGAPPATLLTHLVDGVGRQISGSDRPL